jgi:predicted RNA binding protein YcfA (HicA-like mRNA interferase family)
LGSIDGDDRPRDDERLEKDGWVVVRQKGSHRQMQHSTKRGTVTVAGKPSKTLHPKIVASILRRAGLED